jgi:hypothetical protein
MTGEMVTQAFTKLKFNKSYFHTPKNFERVQRQVAPPDYKFHGQMGKYCMSVLYTTEFSDLECTAEVDEQFHRVDMDVSAGSEFITCQANYYT